MGAGLEMNQLELVKSLVKWGRTVYETRRIPEYISMAFRHALTGKPGPVYLDIPEDVMYKSIDEDSITYPEKYRTEAKSQGDPRDIQKAVELMLNAKRPLVIGGSGVWWSQASEELRELIEMVKLPVILRPKGRGSVPEDHPLFVGPATVGIGQADVILAVGIRFTAGLGFGRPPLFDEKAKVIHVDIDGSVIGQNRPIDIGIIGDAKLVLKQMADEARDRCKGREESLWIEECRAAYKKWRETFEAGADSDAVPIHPARLRKEIKDFLDRDAIVTVDGGEAGQWGRLSFNAYYPGHLIDHTPNAQLGSAFPFGIGAKLAKPDKQVLVFNGDGAWAINGMEFDTAVRHNIPVVNVVSNNGCWGTCIHRSERLYGRAIGVELGFTRYDKVVEALGGYGEWVEKPEDIRPALQRAFASGLPACVNVKTDPSVAFAR
jgi:acetolactate synthase-1/2/3 large subunit